MLHKAIPKIHPEQGFLAIWCLSCSSPLFISSLPGRLQGHDGFLPVLRHGQLLLAAGGGVVPSHPAGHLLLLGEEVLLVVHLNRLGYASPPRWAPGGDPEWHF